MNPHCSNRSSQSRRIGLIVLLTCLLLIGTTAAHGTLAWLHSSCPIRTNHFHAPSVSCQVEENFDGICKSNVTVTNTGSIPAYVRVRLVTFRTDASGHRIGGSAPIPPFSLGKGWVQDGDFYYYTAPVAPAHRPQMPLIDAEGIFLTDYSDPDGGRQVVEVMAEAIQADGVSTGGIKAVVDAWGLNPEAGSYGGKTT